MEDRKVYDKGANDEAIAHICGYFDEEGLTLFERWHVCECIASACLSMMSEHMRDACSKIKEEDIEEVRKSFDQQSSSDPISRISSRNFS